MVQQLFRGNAVGVIIILGLGGSFQLGHQVTSLSSPSPFIQKFINGSWYDRYGEVPSIGTTTMIWSLIVGTLPIGGLCGTLSVRYISSRLGRKKVMIFTSFIYIAGAGFMLTCKRLKSFEMVIVGRILFGICAGLGGTTHLMYLGECSLRKIRGLVTQTYMIFIVLGKMSGQVFGIREILGCEETWEVIPCVPIVFSVLLIIVLPFIPEAPRYLLIEKNDEVACKKALQTLWGPGDYKQEMTELLQEQEAIKAAPPKSMVQLLRKKSVRLQVITISLICFCNMTSGMNSINMFAFDICLEAGIPKHQIQYVILGLGVSETVFSFFCGLLVDRIGRRPLFVCGYGVMSASWVLVIVTAYLKDSIWWASYCTTGVIIIFIVFFSGGPQGTAATLSTEIFIQSDRMAALVIMQLLRWLLLSALGLAFPFLIGAFGSYAFLLFVFTCLLGCIYTFLFLPETKRKTPLEISEEFQRITVCGKTFAEEESVETKF